MVKRTEKRGTDEVQIGSDLPDDPSLESSTMADAQTEIIKRARKLLCPSEVKTGRIPRWMRTKLQALQRQGIINSCHKDFYLEDLKRVADGEQSPIRSWLDHWGWTDWNFHECFVAEPYGLDEGAMKSIARFAELLDAEYCISANSWHYPGSTIRILFYKGQPK